MEKGIKVKKVEVKIPVGYDLVINGTDCRLVPEKDKLPKTWEEFCKTHLVKEDECYLCGNVDGISVFGKHSDLSRDPRCRDILPNKETAEAVLALMQLLQLRKCYNGDWVPDWADSESWKYNIESNCDKIICSMSKTNSRVLAFKTIKLRDQFFKNFRDLIEIVKPLI